MRNYIMKYRYSNEVGCAKNGYRYRKVPFTAESNEKAVDYAKAYIRAINALPNRHDYVDHCRVCFSTCKSFAYIEF